MAHDVFISYANPDKKLADVLCAALEAERIRCWVAPRDVIPGRSYGAQILQAETRKSSIRWLFAGGIAAMALAAAVVLQLHESPPAQPPASGNEAQHDREEIARLEAAAAKRGLTRKSPSYGPRRSWQWRGLKRKLPDFGARGAVRAKPAVVRAPRPPATAPTLATAPTPRQ